jgi:hypothetical protein
LGVSHVAVGCTAVGVDSDWMRVVNEVGELASSNSVPCTGCKLSVNASPFVPEGGYTAANSESCGFLGWAIDAPANGVTAIRLLVAAKESGGNSLSAMG